MSQVVGLRYAKALVNEAYNQKNGTEIIDSFLTLVEQIEANEKLDVLLRNVTVRANQKLSVLQPIMAALAAPQLVNNFISVLAQNGRFSALASIAKAVRNLRDQREGVQEVTLTGSDAFKDAEQVSVQEKFAKALGRKVRLKVQVDPALLGGLKAQLGSTVFDGSLSGRMHRMRTELMKE